MEKKKDERPVTVNITNHNQFQKGVGAFITNLNHLTIVMDSEGNMKLDANQVPAPVMPHTEVETQLQGEIEEESPEDETGDDSSSISKCFRFASDFVRQKVTALVKKYYKGSHAELALMEITLYDHGQLKKRNAHTAFVRSLVVWGIVKVADEEAFKQIVKGITDKFGRMPETGYKEWGQELLNDKETCINIGKELGETMPYNRSEK